MHHISEPDKATEERDQRDFDDAVNRDGKYILEGLAAVGIVVAIVMSAVALIKSGSQSTSKTVTEIRAGQVIAAAPTPAIKRTASRLNVTITGGSKLGPDGKKHDAYSKTTFPVKVGQPLKLRINNTDDVPHNIVAPAANINILVKPGTHTYTLMVSTAGKYLWFCTIPCDTDANGWAMQNAGFMSGYITAT